MNLDPYKVSDKCCHNYPKYEDLMSNLIIKAGTIYRIINWLIDKFHKSDYRYWFANNRLFDLCVCNFTVFTLSIQTPQPLTIFYLKFEQITTHCCV